MREPSRKRSYKITRVNVSHPSLDESVTGTFECSESVANLQCRQCGGAAVALSSRGSCRFVVRTSMPSISKSHALVRRARALPLCHHCCHTLPRLRPAPALDCTVGPRHQRLPHLLGRSVSRLQRAGRRRAPLDRYGERRRLLSLPQSATRRGLLHGRHRV